jgi:hypothetical protein
VIRTWTCRHCGGGWPRKYALCRTPACKGKRPAKRIPKHREIMAVPYERYGARGVLCQRCNRYLPYFATVDWLLNAAKYLDRSPITRL